MKRAAKIFLLSDIIYPWCRFAGRDLCKHAGAGRYLPWRERSSFGMDGPAGMLRMIFIFQVFALATFWRMIRREISNA